MGIIKESLQGFVTCSFDFNNFRVTFSIFSERKPAFKRLAWKATLKGEKLISQVGDNKAVIKFTGAEGKAVEEYRKRCSDFL